MGIYFLKNSNYEEKMMKFKVSTNDFQISFQKQLPLPFFLCLSNAFNYF